MKIFLTEVSSPNLDMILKKYVDHHNGEKINQEFVDDTMREVKNIFGGKSIKTIKKDGKMIAKYVCMNSCCKKTVFYVAQKNKFVISTYDDFVKKHNIKP